MRSPTYNPCFIFTILLFLSGTILPGLRAQERTNPYPNSHFITVDSIGFHYRLWNGSLEKPRGKVLLVHGFLGSTFCWRENTELLAKAGYKVVAVDLPGFGYSERTANINQSQSNKARLLWAFLRIIDKLDTSGWNIVGHSMGGGTAEAMAIMNPSMTRSLTIVDGMVFLKNENMQGAFVTLSRNKQYNKVFSSLVKKEVLTYGMVEKLLKKNYGFIPDSLVVKGYLVPLQIEGSAESIMSVFSNSKEIEELNAAKLSSTPILVVWGRKDKTISLSRGINFVKKISSSTLVIIHNCKHHPMETNPEEFNRSLIQFLNSNNL
jgi:2-hydroxy-6-oxonona-2,4-dienedioate hydrolase